ncbi:hypothetical protein DFH11DRAFT_1521257 [Phellopilus nigrolimitatus]|nr:hypothetical protein DFH11DRAFT_1521257 [Phellopilus nigrolimitatus]
MGRKHWTKLDERAFLYKLLPDFIKAKNENRSTVFLNSAYELYFNEFPLCPPTAEDIEAARGNVELARTQKKTFKTVKLYNWFYNHARESTSGSGKRGRLNLCKKKKHGSMQEYQVYIKLCGQRWKSETKAAHSKLKDETPSGTKCKPYIAFAADKAREALRTESDKMKKRVEEVMKEYNSGNIEEIESEASDEEMEQDDNEGSRSPTPPKTGKSKSAIDRMQK